MIKRLPDHLTLENTVRMGRRVRVSLDGAQMQGVVEAHVAEGWVKRLKLNDSGKPFILGDELVTETILGDVTATEVP